MPTIACLRCLLVLLCTAVWIGCGSGASRGKVNGKIVANGQPVTAGQLTFNPVAGMEGATAAVGTVNADGTFELQTIKPGDGAAIGKHTVSYTAPAPEGPEWDGYGTPPPMNHSPFEGMIPKENEVEVKAGNNDITIELVPFTPGGS